MGAINELLRVSCVVVAFSATLRFSALVFSFVPGLVSDLGGTKLVQSKVESMRCISRSSFWTNY